MFYHVSKACGASFQAEESHAVICSIDDIQSSFVVLRELYFKIQILSSVYVANEETCDKSERHTCKVLFWKGLCRWGTCSLLKLQ